MVGLELARFLLLSTLFDVTIGYQYYSPLKYRRSAANNRRLALLQPPAPQPAVRRSVPPPPAAAQYRSSSVVYHKANVRQFRRPLVQYDTPARPPPPPPPLPPIKPQIQKRIEPVRSSSTSYYATAKATNCRLQKCKELFPKYKRRDDGEKMCYAFGDPHTSSFDGKMNDYQGHCKHVLSKADRPVPFTIYSKSTQFRFAMGSVPNYIEVDVYGQNVHMGALGVFKVNGKTTEAPYIYPEGTDCYLPCKIFVESEPWSSTAYVRNATSFKMIVRKILRFTLWTDFGLKTTFVGDNEEAGTYEVMPPLTTKGHTKGLCGIWNDKKDDDYSMPNGLIAKSDKEFGNSWVVPDAAEPKCDVSKMGGRLMQCSMMEQYSEGGQLCSLLDNRTGVFKPCLADKDLLSAAWRFYRGCIYDYCATKDENFAVAAFDEFAQMCREKLGLRIEWQPTFRVHAAKVATDRVYYAWLDKCNAVGMTYDETAMSQPTCENPNVVHAAAGTKTEGACRCLSYRDVYDVRTKKCIDRSDCGCKDAQSRKYELGSTWLSEGCTSKKSCRPDRTIGETAFSCPIDSACSSYSGRGNCFCRRGFETLEDGSCSEINECARNPGLCGDHGECVNIPGSYVCACKNGYHAKANQPCRKISSGSVDSLLEALSCNSAQYKAVAMVCSKLLLDSAGPFKRCLANDDLAFQAQTRFRQCVADECSARSTVARKTYAQVGTFAAACQTQLQLGKIEWAAYLRVLEQQYALQTVFVETKVCPAKMRFMSTAASTPTCELPDFEFANSSDPSNSGACVCTKGLLFDTTTESCVQAIRCGCVDNGTFFKQGQKWLPMSCRVEKTCNQDRSIIERPYQCGHDEDCVASESLAGTFVCSKRPDDD